MNNDEIRKAYLYAIEKGVSQGHIAEKTHLPVDSLRKYKETGSLGPERRRILGEWLNREGYTEGMKYSDPLLVLAAELRNLATVLESGIKRETKEKRFMAFFDAYGSPASRAAEDPSEYRP